MASAAWSAPLMFITATLSIAITLGVAIGTLVEGRMPSEAPLGLIVAVVLAACAAAEASQPARNERSRRHTADARRARDPYAR